MERQEEPRRHVGAEEVRRIGEVGGTNTAKRTREIRGIGESRGPASWEVGVVGEVEEARVHAYGRELGRWETSRSLEG